MRVQRANGWAEYAELAALFFLNAMALGMWFVPLGMVLDAHGLHSIRPYAFATSAIAAFISPLIFGAMADRRGSPVVVLRWLAVATAIAMAFASTAIHLGWNRWLVLAIIQVHALCSAPGWSLSTTIVLSRLQNSKRQFGPVRAVATLGWMAGCWLVSWLNADASVLSGFGGAFIWLLVAAFTFVLPGVPPPKSTGHLSLKERLGLDALTLLKNADHRVVFVTAALFSIPLAAFYPYSPTHMRDLGLEHPSALMSLGQITEIIAMLGLAYLLAAFRLKWLFAAGLSIGLIRFLLCAMDSQPSLLAGVTLHGFAFTLVFITTQIYLDERIDPAWKARAQALMSFMTGGIGNLIGYLGTGWWFNVCDKPSGTNWPLFWSVLAGVIGLVLVYFMVAYHGRGSQPEETKG
ncbi:MAG: major facilitator superfamily 1 [Verrucomicrobia bacterium]|jgi:nucleoside transporter|nr:major facilitator superfamily 1 [Verrucomicrobiota bacterium]